MEIVVTSGKMKLRVLTEKKNENSFVDFESHRDGYLQNYVSTFYNHGCRSAISQSRIEFGIIINVLKVKVAEEETVEKQISLGTETEAPPSGAASEPAVIRKQIYLFTRCTLDYPVVRNEKCRFAK